MKLKTLAGIVAIGTATLGCGQHRSYERPREIGAVVVKKEKVPNTFKLPPMRLEAVDHNVTIESRWCTATIDNRKLYEKVDEGQTVSVVYQPVYAYPVGGWVDDTHYEGCRVLNINGIKIQNEKR